MYVLLHINSTSCRKFGRISGWPTGYPAGWPAKYLDIYIYIYIDFSLGRPNPRLVEQSDATRSMLSPNGSRSRPTGPGSSHGDAELRQVSVPRSPKGRPAAPKGVHGAPKVSPERSKGSETDAQRRENEGPETRKVVPTTIEAQQLRKVKKRVPSRRELDL